MNSRKIFIGIVALAFSISFLVWAGGVQAAGLSLEAESTNQYLSKIFITTAVTLMAFDFLIATRAKWLENLMGGLDTMYRVHSNLGKLAFVLILSHPILLSLSSLGAPSFLNFYIPSDITAYNWGIAALWLFSLLILISIFRFMPYHIWKFTHKLIGIPMILAMLHVFFINSYISDYTPYQFWIYGWFFVGIGSYFYKSFFYQVLAEKPYQVEAVRELGDITEIWLEATHHSNYIRDAKPGRYLFLSVKGRAEIGSEEHPYSISALEEDGMRIRLSVKNLGDHSGKLNLLKPGDRVGLKGAHGFFSATHPRATGTQIWLAGGVGVTPFLSMLQQEADFEHQERLHYANISESRRAMPRPRIHFFYATKVEPEAVYDEEVSKVTDDLERTTLYKHYSDEDGYMTADWILEQAGIKKSEVGKLSILQCGPPGMMKALEKQFLDLGVPKSQIIYEEFSFA